MSQPQPHVALAATDPRVNTVDAGLVEIVRRDRARVEVRLDRAWPRLVIRTPPMNMAVLVTAATIVDERTGSAPTKPAPDRGEGAATLSVEQAHDLAGELRDGDRVSVHWTTAVATLKDRPPTGRVTAVIHLHHADGTTWQSPPIGGRYRTAPAGERTL